MCRLLGVVATTPATIVDLIPDELARFEALSAVHPDGWGIAYVAPDGADRTGSDGAIRVTKAPGRASTSDTWHAAVRGIVSDTALLHLRQASPGMPLIPANTHPFLAGGTAFAHNGHASPRATLDGLVEEAGMPIPDGDTDSERYFALVRAGSADGLRERALRSAADRIASLATATSLNALLLTPRELIALAWWHAPVIRRAGEGETERDYRLWYRIARDRVVVASAEVAGHGPPWCELPHGHTITIERGTLATRVMPEIPDAPAA